MQLIIKKKLFLLLKLNHMFKKISNYFRDLADSQRISIGLAKGGGAMQARSIDPKVPATWEFSGFSQNGEDGIIDILISMLKEKNRYFIEIGSSDGLENNTAWLSMVRKFNGLMIEGSLHSHIRSTRVAARCNIGVECVNMFVSRENVQNLKLRAIHWDPDVLSLDIDGNDYYIAKKLMDAGCRPKIFVVEYNSVYGPERSLTIKYAENFVSAEAHRTQLYYGVSIMGWRNLLSRHGYKFVTVDQNGVNAFFVNPEHFDDNFLNAVQGLDFAENISQLLRFKSSFKEQFKLIEDQKFETIE